MDSYREGDEGRCEMHGLTMVTGYLQSPFIIQVYRECGCVLNMHPGFQL